MCSRFLARILLSLVVKLRVIGAEKTARPGAYILAANHISHFDPPIIGVVARRKIDWMAMVELFAHPIVRAWMLAIDSFSVDRGRPDRAAVRTALDRLEKNRVCGIFPEGGIRDGEASVLEGAPLRPGIGTIAHLSGAPIVPCVIVGSDRLYSRKAWLPFRRTTVWIAFGEPLPCPVGGKAARDALEAALGESLRSLLKQLQDQFSLSKDDLPKPPSRRKGNH